jgi:hypothetical protein
LKAGEALAPLPAPFGGQHLVKLPPSHLMSLLAKACENVSELRREKVTSIHRDHLTQLHRRAAQMRVDRPGAWHCPG